MASILNIKSPQVVARLEWLPVLAGLLALYVQTFYEFSTTLWLQDEYAHGPIILAVIIWLTWKGRKAFLDLSSSKNAPKAGFGLLVFGLLLYVLGRSQDIALVEISALIPILAGVLLAMRGGAALHALWFPIFFVVFLIPIPGTFTDALTGPLKQHVSEIAEQVLYAAGYPIARDGVTLTIGQYQLLVADACSGLNTMYSLSALGILFMYLMARPSWLHNAIMLAAILPIAFVANVIRVLILILITYYFGDAAGQGYLHASAGIVLLLVSLTALLVLDGTLARITKRHQPTGRK
jgi:exosortase B